MTTLTPAQGALRAFAQAALRGPWTCELVAGQWVVFGPIGTHQVATVNHPWERDAAFIAAANPAAVLALLDELAAARKDRDTYQQHMNNMSEQHLALAKALETARGALWQYGKHDSECLAGGKPASEVKCICGLEAARAHLATPADDGEGR